MRAVLFSLLFLTISVNAETLNCESLLVNPVGEAAAKVSNAFKARFLRALGKDPRYAALVLAKASPTFEALDLLSSPALETTAIFAPDNRAESFAALTALKNSRALTESLKLQAQLSPFAVALLNAIETKVRWAAAILTFAENREVSKAELSQTLLEQTLAISEELAQNKKLNRNDLPSFNPVTLLHDLETRLELEPKLEISNELRLRPEFAKLIPQGSLSQKIAGVGLALDQILTQLPVGVSFRMEELASTVRFADVQLYGPHSCCRTTTRKAYLRGAIQKGGMIEAELNVNNDKKKTLAVRLARGHLNLDPLSGERRYRDFDNSTCGSYAPMVLTFSGVPILAPGYLTPGGCMISLAMQRALRLPTVKSFGAYGIRTKKLLSVLPTTLVHDIIPPFAESAVYAAVVYGLAHLF